MVMGMTKSSNSGGKQHEKPRTPSPLRIDMTGLRFGMLTVIEAAGNTTKGLALWKCQCDCGKFVIHPGTVLRGQRAYSCGCTKRPEDWEHIPANGVRYGLDYLRGVLKNGDGNV